MFAVYQYADQDLAHLQWCCDLSLDFFVHHVTIGAAGKKKIRMMGLVVIGLMSGTSVDGIDAAVLKTDGSNFQALGCPSVYDYRDETRDAIWTAVANPDALMRDESAR